MAKKRARGAGREMTRAELKAFERRSQSGAAYPVSSAVAEAAVDEAPAPAASSGASTRRGVLPPRPSRVAAGVQTLSRAQEMAFIQGDLRRLTILAGLMLALLVVLAIFLR
jgi:hypothetical protein